MQLAFRISLQRRCCIGINPPFNEWRRHASLTSAINRGIRKAKDGVHRFEKRAANNVDANQHLELEDEPGEARMSFNRGRSYSATRNSHGQNEGKVRRATRDFQGHRGRSMAQNPSVDRNTRRLYVESSSNVPREVAREVDASQHLTPSSIRHVKVPISIPYSTAGSEFLYGTFPVMAALRSGRRKLYKLYIYQSGEHGDSGKENDCQNRMRKLALAAGVTVSEVTGGWDKLLLKMSGQRPHNGYVLEASPIPILPVTALENVEKHSGTFEVVLGHQSAEELAINKSFTMNGSYASIPSCGDGRRYPFVLMLDGILDPGNLGAIIRSAYFLGVDAVVMIKHGSAPISAVALKASAGAAEYLPLLSIGNEHAFMKSSQSQGWTFFAAMSPDTTPKLNNKAVRFSSRSISSAVNQGPCVLILGSEGEGIRPQLQKLADGAVGVRSGRNDLSGVDSLNVSVAAAVLIQQFLGTDSSPDRIRSPENEIVEAEDKKRF